MSVLRRLRRASKDIPSQSMLHATQSSDATLPTPLEQDKLTFFDLPAELRNVVYELSAADCVLHLRDHKKEQKSSTPPISGLLLASKQCRREYLYLFYSTAPVIVEIKDFDFRNVIRVVGSLYSTELKALRDNANLVLRLRTQNCTKENMTSLRKWLVNRADSLDRLPWRYEIGHAPVSTKMSCFRLSRELAFYRERLARMQAKLEDSLQWELHDMLIAFEQKGKELDAVLQGARPSIQDPTTLRGLSGGGVL